MCCCLFMTSASPRLAWRCLPYLAGSLLLWVIILPWSLTWAPCRNSSPPSRRALYPQYRLSMSRLMTWWTLLLPLPLPMWMLPLSCPVLLLSWASIPLWILWTLRPASWIIGSKHHGVAGKRQNIRWKYRSLQDIIAILAMDELSEENNLTVPRACKIQCFLSQPCQVLRSSHATWGSWSPWRRPAKHSSRLWQVNIFQSRPSNVVGSIEEAVTKADKLAEEHLWGPFGKLQAPHTAPSLSLQNSSIACVSHAGALTGDVMFFLKNV